MRYRKDYNFMKVKVEELGPVQKRMSVELPAEMVARELDRAYNKLRKNVSVSGFRKGKAPRSILERQYGPEVENEVLEKLVQDTLPQALKEADEVLILAPKVDSASRIKAGESFSYTALLDLWPEFDLPDYRNIELTRPRAEVTEEEIQEQIQALRSHFATVEDVEEDRPVEEGDLAVIDYVGVIDGEPAKGLTADNYYIEVGSGYFNPEFEKQLLGMEKGSEKSIEITYPEDAVNENVAGKTVIYEVELVSIKKKVLPELDTDFIRNLGSDFKSVEDVEERLRQQIQKDKEEAVQSSLRNQLLDRLVEQTDFPVPERLIEQKLMQMVDNVSNHLQERGMDLDTAGMSEDRLKDKMRDDAVYQVRADLILDRIAEKEEIMVDHDEASQYSDYLESQSDRMGLDKTQVQAAVVQHVLPKLRARKVVEFLLEQAEIKEESKED
ncbi:MAG TPA: trigger factor [Thermodesulfobacteriaceae bacterium]|nr:trigger factor [Thermodesulfobacteriaceae bacterium]